MNGNFLVGGHLSLSFPCHTLSSKPRTAVLRKEGQQLELITNNNQRINTEVTEESDEKDKINK